MSGSTSGFSDFDEISVSEARGGTFEVDNNKNKVEVVLPPELLLKPAPPASPDARPENDNDKKPPASSSPKTSPSAQPDTASVASSFVPVGRMGALGINGNESVVSKLKSEDNSSTASWSRLGGEHRGGAAASVAHTTASETTTGGWTAPSAASYNHNNNNHDQKQPPMSSNASCASSVVSGFDCLNIGGYSMRRCHLDGYLNEPNATICEGCGAALVANPCVDTDHQIALNLQQKEEREAFERVQQRERKRKQLHQLSDAEQGDWLAVEVEQFVMQSFAQHGYQAVPAADLARLASLFVPCGRDRMHRGGDDVYLAFTFTGKQAGQIRAIERHGLSSARHEVRVFDSAVDAWQYRMEYDVPFESNHPLHPIHEQYDESSGRYEYHSPYRHQHHHDPRGYHHGGGRHYHGRGGRSYRRGHELGHGASSDPNECVGWIVAVAPGRCHGDFNGHATSQPIKRMHVPAPVLEDLAGSSPSSAARSEVVHRYNLTTVFGPHATLPLVCFDASLRGRDETLRLFQGLQTVCLDFFTSVGVLPAPVNTDPLHYFGGTSFNETFSDDIQQQPHSFKRPKVDSNSSVSVMDDPNNCCSIRFGGYEMRPCTVCDQLIVAQLPCPRGCEDQKEKEEAALAADGKVPLPPGWREYFDQATNLPYYFNETTGKSVWERPTATTSTEASGEGSSSNNKKQEWVCDKCDASFPCHKDAIEHEAACTKTSEDGKKATSTDEMDQSDAAQVGMKTDENATASDMDQRKLDQSKDKNEVKVEKDATKPSPNDESMSNGATTSESVKAETRIKQQRLLLLRHASICKHPAGQCPVTVHCNSIKELWKHMVDCKDSNCKYEHCVSSRCILSHYRKCKDAACDVCGPVRDTIRRKKTRGEGPASGFQHVLAQHGLVQNQASFDPAVSEPLGPTEKPTTTATVNNRSEAFVPGGRRIERAHSAQSFFHSTEGKSSCRKGSNESPAGWLAGRD